MLFDYIQQTQRFLQFDERQAIYNPADLTRFINEARGQIALSSESIRIPAQLALVEGQQSYLFSAATPVASPTVPKGVQQVANVRMARLLLVTGGYKRLEMRSWEYFETFWLDRTIPAMDYPPNPGGSPRICARLQPGLSGTLWVAPTPNQDYELILDAVMWPAPLVYANGDADPEALPYPWTDAVPLFAAFLAYLSDGDDAGMARMQTQMMQFEHRAVQMTTPSRLPRNYPGGRGASLANSMMQLTLPPQAPAARR
jgi:hypothetical protein